MLILFFVSQFQYIQLFEVFKPEIRGRLFVNMNCIYRFKFCKSVHHRIIQINQQLDATIFQFIILTYIYSSTCFGRFPGHHQELNDCSGSLWFYLRIVVIAVLGRPDREHSTVITTIRR